MYSNVRGLKSKVHGLTTILNEMKPNLFFLTETQLRTNTGVNIPGYTFHGRKREGKVGGGVGFLIKDDIKQNVYVHTSERDLEITWARIRRKKLPPLIVGTYYGKQESISNEDIVAEMTLLHEEIEERKKDGEILLTMDANGKIGILGEEKSRNGKKILEVFENTNLHIMNLSDKCRGKITRKNTQKERETSAIDFVVASDQAEKWISEMIIDEDELMKIKGKNDTDHNTISIYLTISSIEKIKVEKRTGWNLRAPEEKWNEFNDQLIINKRKANEILKDETKPFDTRYKHWYNYLEGIARGTIGKTTFTKKKETTTKEIKELQRQKKEKNKEIHQEKNKEERMKKIEECKVIQEQIRRQCIIEKAKTIEEKFTQVISDKSRRSFWDLKRQLSNDPSQDLLIVKNENGVRQFDPEGNKETYASYYEQLFKRKTFDYHPYHDEIKEKIQIYSNDTSFDNLDYNSIPTKTEIKTIINLKKNNKSTPDIKNEMLKIPGDAMVDFIYPLIETMIKNEQVPRIFNRGYITSLHKGKGDKEIFANHRGITTSCSIGTILDSVLHNRMEQLILFSQAQGGGKKHTSTCDHLFIVRAIIDISKAQKRQTFLTFYDVSKAYDNIDNEHLLVTMWEKGLRGKMWRLLKALNSDLTAVIKTRFGHTREINMEIGGKQGSRLTGFMFAKQMDLLAEELTAAKEGFKLSDEFIIAVLLWVDDVLSMAEGEDE